MAIRSLSFASFTPGAGVADAVNQVDSTHLTVAGLTATERVVLQELFLGGLAPSASSPMVMVLARTRISGWSRSAATLATATNSAVHRCATRHCNRRSSTTVLSRDWKTLFSTT